MKKTVIHWCKEIEAADTKKHVCVASAQHTMGAFVWEYSGIRIYSGYSAPGSRITGMEIQVFRNRKSIYIYIIIKLYKVFHGWIDEVNFSLRVGRGRCTSWVLYSLASLHSSFHSWSVLFNYRCLFSALSWCLLVSYFDGHICNTAYRGETKNSAEKK